MFGPVVFVATLWSWVGPVQPLQTDPRQKTRWDEQQTVRIIVDLDLQAIVCRLTVPPRVGRDLWNSGLSPLVCSIDLLVSMSSDEPGKRRDDWHYVSSWRSVVVFYPFPWPLLVEKSDLPACGPLASFFVHLAISALTPAGSVRKSMGDNVVRMWVQLKRWCVSRVRVLQRGNSGDGCVLVSTLCKYTLMKGDLFVLSCVRVRRVRRGCISSEMLMCGGGVRSILLLPVVARCLETINVCMGHVCCSDCVGLCGNVCCVATLEFWSMLYVRVRDVMDIFCRVWSEQSACCFV